MQIPLKRFYLAYPFIFRMLSPYRKISTYKPTLNKIGGYGMDHELSSVEAAKVLGLSPNTLRKWRCTQEQPTLLWHKRFRKVFYLKSNVENFKVASTENNIQETYI